MKRWLSSIFIAVAMLISVPASASAFDQMYIVDQPLYDTVAFASDTADPAMPGSVIAADDVAAVNPRIWLFGSYAYLETVSGFNVVACSTYISADKDPLFKVLIVI